MSFTDKTLQCAGCGNSFVFTEKEQEFFASKGFTNEPKRCPLCRETRKTERYGSGGSGGYGGSGGSGGYAPRREMYPAVCAECGKETQVPFEPRQGRPVYCSDCYNKVKLTQRR